MYETSLKWIGHQIKHCWWCGHWTFPPSNRIRSTFSLYPSQPVLIGACSAQHGWKFIDTALTSNFLFWDDHWELKRIMSRLIRWYTGVLQKHPWKTQAATTGDNSKFLEPMKSAEHWHWLVYHGLWSNKWSMPRSRFLFIDSIAH